MRIAAENIPVEVTGEPTDHVEVSHRDLERVETNQLRGGALLAMVEGVIQKAPKVRKYAKKLDISGWYWLEKFSKDQKSEKKREKTPKLMINTCRILSAEDQCYRIPRLKEVSV